MNFKWLQKLVPTYGNWGGPGWSGGEWQSDTNLTKWDVKPIDNMDAMFRDHDMAYQTAIYTHRSSDYMLVKQLCYNCPVQGWYANVYKIAAIIIFFIRSIGGKS